MRRTLIATALVAMIAALPASQAGSVILSQTYDSLSLGKDQTAPFSNCDRIGSCLDLTGISLWDYDISDDVDGVPTGWSIRYELKDAGTAGYQLVAYRMCQYKASGILIRCDQDSSAAWWLMGSINRHTATVRVILMSGADRDYRLSIWAGQGNF